MRREDVEKKGRMGKPKDKERKRQEMGGEKGKGVKASGKTRQRTNGPAARADEDGSVSTLRHLHGATVQVDVGEAASVCQAEVRLAQPKPAVHRGPGMLGLRGVRLPGLRTGPVAVQASQAN